MRFKVKARPTLNQRRWIRRFAWLPIRGATEQIWLEPILCEQKYSRAMKNWCETRRIRLLKPNAGKFFGNDFDSYKWYLSWERELEQPGSQD